MKKLKIFLSFEKEQKWLEKMAAKGWQLNKQRLLYTFVSSKPSTANIKIDYRYFKNENDFLEYRTLFEDSGWKHLSGTKFSGNQYFMQTSDTGGTDIFSDESSKAARYQRLAYGMLSMICIFFSFVIISYNQGTLGLDAITSPGELYLTPGLWELNGAEFWRAFLFETPFALMRGVSAIFGLLMFFGCVFLTAKSWALHRKAAKASDI